MQLVHICPVCGNKYDKEGVPAPNGESDSPCPECNGKLHHIVNIGIVLDYGIYELTKDEESFLRCALNLACRKRGCEIMKLEVQK